ncbi:MAG: hypothetical protein JWR07_1953 [Nevskia sp.]|nr:hypothetical protein [Nevskia sp.]
MSARLRWKMHAKKTGLMAIGAGPRGSDYTDGVNWYATVYAHSTRHTGIKGWYWVSTLAEHRNTCNEKPVDEATAKAQAQAYVKAQLAALPRNQSPL